MYWALGIARWASLGEGEEELGDVAGAAVDDGDGADFGGRVGEGDGGGPAGRLHCGFGAVEGVVDGGVTIGAVGQEAAVGVKGQAGRGHMEAGAEARQAGCLAVAYAGGVARGGVAEVVISARGPGGLGIPGAFGESEHLGQHALLDHVERAVCLSP